MKLRRSSQLWLLLLVVGLLLTGCSGSEPATATPVPTAIVSATAARPTSAANPATTTTTSAATVSAGAATTPAGASSAPIGPVAPPTQTPAQPEPVPILSAQQGAAVPLKTQWKASVEEAGPAEIVGEQSGLVFVKTLTGSLYAYNTSDGSLVWKQVQSPRPKPSPSPTPTFPPSLTPGATLPPDIPAPPRAPFSTVVSGTVLIGDASAETLRAYEAKTGQKKWEADLRFEAPNRDPNTRWLPGAIYNDLVVTAVSTKINPYAARTSSNPEYLRLLALDINTGQPKWAFVPNPARPNTESRNADVIFGSKYIIVEGPDFSTYGVNPQTGTSLWQALGLFLLPYPDPDVLYSSIPQPPGKPSNPLIRRVDASNGRILWQRVLDTQVSVPPALTISPDEKTAYVAVFTSGQKSLLSTFYFQENQIRQTDTSAYGLYDMFPTNEGIYLIQSSPKASGMVYLDLQRDKPSWAIGGQLELIFGPQFSADKSVAYLTFKNELGQAFLYSLNVKSGQVLTATSVELPTAPLIFGSGEKTIYLIGNTTKPQLYALSK